MKVTDKEVSYVADLANLDLTAEERIRMLRDLNSILEHIDTLSALDTTNVAPMTQIMAGTENQQGSAQFGYSRRDDIPAPSLSHEAALQNAPAADSDFFKVPKVIER